MMMRMLFVMMDSDGEGVAQKFSHEDFKLQQRDGPVTDTWGRLCNTSLDCRWRSSNQLRKPA
jgi:hypothetical protein